jgi:hypothetical protein
MGRAFIVRLLTRAPLGGARRVHTGSTRQVSSEPRPDRLAAWWCPLSRQSCRRTGSTKRPREQAAADHLAAVVVPAAELPTASTPAVPAKPAEAEA